MNCTVIDPKIIAKIKKLNNQIESLRGFKTVFGSLTLREQLKLELKEMKLTKLLKQL